MSSSPRQSSVTSDKEATVVSSPSLKGETLVIRKAIQRKLEHLQDLTSQAVDENTDLEKLKNYQI